MEPKQNQTQLQQTQSQALTEQQRDPEKKNRPLAKVGLAIGAAVLALAVGGGIFFNNSGPPPDQPTQSQIAEMKSSWEAAQRLGISLPSVQPGEEAEALASTKLPEKEKAALQEEMSAGRASMVWVTVWDNMVEDGDVISLYSEGLTITVPLLKAPQRIAIPRPTGGVVNLTGIKDGGGGITLGLMSGPDQVLIPPLTPGQTVGIPVR